ncbi:MAG TPA: hypothetical protein EYH55_01160 [Methanothermococcus okinawensis]|uniref:DUF5518 domain-containing protein n=1 Tax=Methanothermococcus okinawensis TaxID=155863 RepID=A0A833ECY9_9EURY|nr:hypothetical protein [Methanothermococcus okinawensis]
MKLGEVVRPALIGGVITGILAFIFSFIPLVGYCSCFLYLLSGIITGYLLSQGYLPSDRDYLISGALSGGIAGFVSWCLDTVITIVDGFLSGTLTTMDMDLAVLALLLFIGILVSTTIGVAFGVVGAAMYRIWKY